MNELLAALWVPTRERCGFVLDDNSIVECPNVHENPEKFFEISLDSIAKYEGRVVATWHTHPMTGPNLSADDYRTFQAYPDWFHYIVSDREVWCYYVRNKAVILVDENDLSARLADAAAP